MTEQEIRITVNRLYKLSYEVMLQTINLMADIRDLKDELNTIPFPDLKGAERNKTAQKRLNVRMQKNDMKE